MIRTLVRAAAAFTTGILASLLLVSTTLAVNVTNTDVLPTPPRTFDLNNPSATATVPDAANANTAINLFEQGPARLMTLILSLFTLVAIVIAIYAGTLIIFSDGDMKKVETGVKTLVYTAIGMLVVGGAWVIVRLVLNINVTSLW